MNQAADKEELLRHLARLRAAQASTPASDDLRAVRSFLQRRLGPTVKRALAARVLGVSQPALDRWIESGDIPTVPTPAGRWEVPARPLVELVGAVAERSRGGERHPLAAVLHERRAAAEDLNVAAIAARLPRSRGGHRAAELRALAYHLAVAQKLDDELVMEARQRLEEWLEESKVDPRYGERWREVLSRPLPEIARSISRDDQRGRDLRQNSPFAGALTEPERRRLLAAMG